MATYGGTDTSGLANADLAGRQQKLKAQMDYAQQVNQGLQGAGQQIQGGLDKGAQGAENMYGRQLEAARSGLELDPKSGKYVETAEAKQKRTFEQGRQVAEYGLERDYKTSQILQRQQELGIEQKRVEGETGLKQQHAATEMARVNVEAQREERLMQEFNTKTGIEKEDARNKLNSGVNDRLEKITDQMIRLQTGDLSAQKETIALLSPLAQSNPKMKAALDEVLSGKTSPEGMKAMMSSLQEQRNQIIIAGAAKTGDISPMEDRDSPTMQEFYAFRNLYTRRMEGDMAAEMQIMQQLPEGERDSMRSYLRLSAKSQVDRVRLANQAAAQGFLGITMARRAAGASSGGTQYGGAGAGLSGPSQPTKLGGSSQPQQQPGGGGGYPGSYLERVKYPPR